MKIEMRDPKSLIAYKNNARTHSDEQIEQLVNSIKSFGFNDPVEVDSDGTIISGHARVLAALRLNLNEVPVVTLAGMDKNAVKAYTLAANKIAQSAGWDLDLLKVELDSLQESDFDVLLTGFNEEEIEALLDPKTTSVEELEKPEKTKSHECPACGYQF